MTESLCVLIFYIISNLESINIENEELSIADSGDSSSSVVFAPNKSSTSSNSTSASVMKAMASAIIPQKQTPPSDIGKKRKRGSSDEMDEIMI